MLINSSYNCCFLIALKIFECLKECFFFTFTIYKYRVQMQPFKWNKSNQMTVAWLNYSWQFYFKSKKTSKKCGAFDKIYTRACCRVNMTRTMFDGWLNLKLKQWFDYNWFWAERYGRICLPAATNTGNIHAIQTKYII